MSVCSIVALALFATVALLLPSTHGTQLSNALAAIKKLQEQVAQLQSSEADNKKLQEQVAQLSKSISQQASKTAGSMYVRWGSASCPQAAQLVYSGVVGGGHWTHNFAAVNALCMPKNPVYDSQVKTTYYAYLYGAEYDTAPESRQDMDVVCAVCLSTRETQMMVPATNQCPDNWTLEYSGHLMAGAYDEASASEYLCMDSAMEYTPDSGANNNGKLFSYTLGQCGSLPCPPYVNDKVLTCVVCSK